MPADNRTGTIEHTSPLLDRYRLTLLAIVAIILGVSCIDPPYPRQIMLQHIPTVLALTLLMMARRWLPLGRASFTLILIFILLHILGARYSYSYVPYDQWSTAIFGTDISTTFAFRRNHYDRLVHFAYGLLFAWPVQEVLEKKFQVRRGLSFYLAVEFIMATSMLYEVFEWLIAIVLSPDTAEAYNGQQGDLWDAQKDMVLATVGAVVAMVVVKARRIDD